MVKKIFKEGIILVLLLLAIVLVLGVLFYDYIPTGKVVPIIEQYQTSEDIKKEINETVNTESTEIIVTYEIDNTDLRTYEKSNEYDKGKENPFADYTAQQEKEPSNTNSVNGNTNNVGNSSTNNTNTNSISNNTNTTNNTTNNTTTTNTNSDGTFFNSTKNK